MPSPEAESAIQLVQLSFHPVRGGRLSRPDGVDRFRSSDRQGSGGAAHERLPRGAQGILQRDHRLERKRNRGTFVAEPSIAEAKDLFDTRRALERLILERVVQRATDADFEHLDRIVADEQRVHDATDEGAKKSLSGLFHIELARLGGNEVMTELLGKVVARISLVMALYEDEHHDDCGTNYHRDIIADLRRRDLAAAQQRMDDHLADIESRVRLTQAQGDRHAFVSVLKAFSAS